MKSNIFACILTCTCLIGFIMACSEGSPYFWANFVGLFLFGGSCYMMGLFNEEIKDEHRDEQDKD